MFEFEGRTMLIATNHAKETVMAPLLEKALGVKCIVAERLNTDRFGTFSGEVARADSPYTTAWNKNMLAMQLHHGDLAMASEGTFGAHYSNPFYNGDHELLLLSDKKNDLEISATFFSTNTNFSGEAIENIDSLLNFAAHAKFPSHGLILRRSKDDHETIIKGIQDQEMLINHFKNLRDRYKSVYVQTDMRAIYNPTRMKVIELTTKKLIKKICSRCPACNSPGFDATAVKAGLPCNLCGGPTQSPLSHIFRCMKCGFEHEEQYPDQVRTEDPKHCDHCNP